MFRRLLLEKKNLDKIEIYRKLLTLQPNTYNLLWLSHFLDLSYSKTMSTITEIDLDIHLIDKRLEPMITSNHKIIISAKLPPEEILTIYLIQQDVPYRFLIEVIEDKYEHLDQFASHNYASPSTVRRKVAPLVKFFAQYGISSRLSTMELIGDERIIRSVLASLLWLCSNGTDLPFSHFNPKAVTYKIKKSLACRPLNNRILSVDDFHKLDADIAYHRIRNHHYVKDDPNYDMVLTETLILEKTEWGAFLGAPFEHQYAETRYMAFRQFFGPVFFDKDDPIFDIPREELPKTAPKLYDFLKQFQTFIDEEILRRYYLSDEDQENIHVLRGNLVMIFFNYLVFKTKVPFFFLLSRTEVLTKNRIYLTLYKKIESFFSKLAAEEEGQWIYCCMDDMCTFFTGLLLPEYELSAKEFNLDIALIIEDQYIYNHKIEKFLNSLTYINFVPFELKKVNDYDLVITSSHIMKSQYPNANIVIFPYTLDEHRFLELRIIIKELHIEKNTLA
ncbi:hypothetical protein M2139_002774 [Enterococcus sp. PF1-24]|uniref:helix-turn-helix domain-containing protein n=1 Tax=unclassified Enterococcus TaxID=2608891 RepID=UPI0024770C30|nr:MULTISPECIES: helix-turn-helix domain-containing protein [unclassified Enterococcus]MDH6365744.1 hypothetical protein [Enterococcus sp. PFB1-1]MDH6402844.1 hypothetical protein [Enterococcus sp. PF1-24]